MILDFCGESHLLRIMYIIKIIVWALRVAVPIILIVSLMIQITKSIASNNSDIIQDILKKGIAKILAAIIFFMVPTLIGIVTNIIGYTKYKECFLTVTIEDVKAAEKAEALRKEEETKQREAEQQKMKDDYYNEYTSKIQNSNISNVNSGEVVSLDGEDYFISTKNGIKYTLYNQADSRWGKMSLNKTTVAAEGCALTTNAVMASGANNSISPLTVINNKQHHSYASTAVPILTNGAYTCSGPNNTSAKSNDTVYNEVINKLKKGDIASIVTTGHNSKFLDTNSHYMAILDYDESTDKVFVGNAYGTGTGNSAYGWFDAKTVISGISKTMYCTPSDELVSKNKNSTTTVNKSKTGEAINLTSGSIIKEYNGVKYVDIIPPHPTTNMPLIIYLHGNGEGYNKINSVKKLPTVVNVENGNLYGSGEFFFIAPSAKSVWNDSSNYAGLWNLIQHVVEEYKIDKNRIYINGFSGGAIGAWYIVSLHPGYFAAATPISGCVNNLTYSNFIGTAVLAESGSSESSYACMPNMVNSINNAGGNAIFKVVPSATDHSSAQQNYPTQELFTWMLSKSK